MLKKVFVESDKYQKDLLHHEQGHYEITSIICRDFFVDCMLLKGRTYAGEQDGKTAVGNIKAKTLDLIGQVHTRYDNDVHPEQDQGKSRGPKQLMWDGFFSGSKSKNRTSGTTDPSGTVTHKQRLLDLLSAAGIRIS